MKVTANPWRGRGFGEAWAKVPYPSTDPGPVARLLARCPVAAETPLRMVPALAAEANLAELRLKDECRRMGLGSFKALGAAHVIAREAEAAGGTLPGRVYVAASAGNHGLSVAAGARVFGATAVIYIAETVPEAFARRLRSEGARVVRAGTDYAASMAAAEATAAREGWRLLSDSTWDGYIDPALGVMEGYLQMAEEVVEAMPGPPTHVFLQAGVGGMAAAVAALFRARWGDAPCLVVVEPDAAPAIRDGLAAGRVVASEGPDSAMGRLDCKEASLVALAALARDADCLATVSDLEAGTAVRALRGAGIDTTPSGAAGVGAILAADAAARAAMGLGEEARALCFVTEGAEG